MDLDQRLAVLRQGMRIRDRSGSPVGFVRDVNGRSVLVGELHSRRVFWIDGAMVDGVKDGEVLVRRQLPST